MVRVAHATVVQRLVLLGIVFWFGAYASTLLADTASIMICEEDDAVGSARFEAPYYGVDGSRQRLLLADETGAAPEGCVRQTLPGIAVDQVLWAGPAEPDLPDEDLYSLTLQGRFDGDAVTVSEVISNIPLASPERSYLPFNESVVRDFEPRAFGVDERVRVEADNTLRCEAGSRVAGVLFRSGRRWLASSPMQLVVEARGSGAFEVAIGDSRRDDEETPLTLGTLAVDDTEPQTFRFPVPGNDRNWSSLTVVCPAESAALRIDDIRMEPREREQEAPRGAWFWSPGFWQDRPETLWAAAEEQGLDELYVSVPTSAGGVESPEALARFLADASERGLAVWAVVGDPHDVLEQSWPALRARMKAFRQFNETSEAGARLAGVQLDIEPYLLPGFAQNHDLWRERWVDTVAVAQDALDGAMPVDLVVPSWWGIHPRWGEKLFAALDWSGVRMTVMNYHTDPERLRHDAEPFLSWGENHGHRIRMALEAGSLPDETQRRYVRSDDDTGRLWLVSVDQTPVLLLLAEPAAGLPGRAFSYSGAVNIPASRYTFDGDLDHLSVVAAALEPYWLGWSAFGGLSIHGLDETRSNGAH
ncbi:hypothetical protein [Aquisalimonas asiatica]|uniref:Uncharacterized protein n=1 Tax=Aquisalimonas asiatica TaxID=406100 RepID=A0A1H8RGG8_9GAMM|nr:hypothetical protein [Aquisalimonas asiatica]SEO65515.1 hypothetical protein SAMN04488052_10210 [Aquisalimonas asiatica]